MDHVGVEGVDIEEEGCVFGGDEFEAYSEAGLGVAGSVLR